MADVANEATGRPMKIAVVRLVGEGGVERTEKWGFVPKGSEPWVRWDSDLQARPALDQLLNRDRAAGIEVAVAQIEADQARTLSQELVDRMLALTPEAARPSWRELLIALRDSAYAAGWYEHGAAQWASKAKDFKAGLTATKGRLDGARERARKAAESADLWREPAKELCKKHRPPGTKGGLSQVRLYEKIQERIAELNDEEARQAATEKRKPVTINLPAQRQVTKEIGAWEDAGIIGLGPGKKGVK